MPASNQDATTVQPGALSALLEELVATAAPRRESSAARVEPGTRVGRFEVVRELGRGGFGVVYEARDTELGRTVALKMVSPGRLAAPADERLLREAEAVARLSHPNIVTLHDVGRGSAGPYLVLERLTGESLAERLKRGRISVREALRIGVGVARGLAHAHTRGIVHRDLAAANVFLCDDGSVKILDLGLAHVFGVRRVDGGTKGYMAPEQERGAPEDERSDVYALGAVLSRALTGEGAGDRVGSRAATAVLDIPELPALADLIARMLAADPVKRPRDAGAVLGALERLEAEVARLPGDRAPAVRQPGAATAAANPVAVLPFADLSPTRDQDWLCDGLAEEIIHVLGGLAGLRVASRSNSFQFKGRSVDAREMARALGVTTLLEGSVRRAGQRVRITARLVDADGYETWSETFDRVLEDAFEVQSEIARAVARVLQVRLSSGESRRIERVGTRNGRAYEMYLRARQLGPTSCVRFRHIRPLLLEAIALDPTFAEAHAALADADYFVLHWQSAPGDPVALRAEALAASDTALRLEPMLAEAHVARANLLALAGKNDEADEEYLRAISLNPGLAEVWHYRARFLFVLGRLPEALEAAEHVARREPDSFTAPGLISLIHHRLGDAERARSAIENARTAAEHRLRLDPDDVTAMGWLGVALIELGEAARGLELIARSVELEPENFGPLYNGACGYAKAGERERALDLLDRAVASGRGMRRWIEVDSDLESIRGTPRFREILGRLPKD